MPTKQLPPPDVGAKPDKPLAGAVAAPPGDRTAPVVEDAERRPAEQRDTKDRPAHQGDRAELPNPSAAKVADSPQPRHSDAWWIDSSTPEVAEHRAADNRGSDKPAQRTPETREQRPDQPAEPQEVAPSASSASPSISPPINVARRAEQPEQLPSSRPQSQEERQESYRDGSWAESGDVGQFPGWGWPSERPSEPASQGKLAEPGVSFDWGKVFETRRGMEGLAEATDSRDTGSAQVDRPGQQVDRGPSKPDAPQDDQPEGTRLWQTIAEETGEVKSFHSYKAARRELGTVPGTEIHHVVEQSQAKPERSGFEVERINSTDNLTRIPIEVHRDITAYYNRNVLGLGIRFRDTLNGVPWEDQCQAGSDVIDEAIENRQKGSEA